MDQILNETYLNFLTLPFNFMLNQILNYIRVSELSISVFIVTILCFLDYKNIRKTHFAKLFFLCLIFLQTSFIIYQHDFLGWAPEWLKLMNYIFFMSAGLLIVPSIYLFVLNQIGSIEKRKKYFFLYFPVILTVVSGIVNFLLDLPNVVLTVLVVVYFSTFLVQLVWVLLFVSKALKKHDQFLEITVSNKEGVSLNWLKPFLTCILLFCVLFLVSSSLLSGIYASLVELGGTGLLMFYFGFHVVALVHQKPVAIVENIEDSSIEKEALSNELNSFRLEKWREKILTKELYLDPDLTLKKLSLEIGIGPQTITRELVKNGTTFYKLINSMRVEKAVQILNNDESQELIIDYITEQVGFKTKTTFYKYFKEILGCTPHEYRNSKK